MRFIVTYVIPTENQAQFRGMMDSGVSTEDLIDMGNKHFDRITELKGSERPLCDAF